jgi:MFS transporter, putative metabolite:H+ symporter
MIFLIRWLTPLAPLALEGWRWALIAGAIVSAITAALFFCVPESPRWLAALGRAEQAEKNYRRFQKTAGAASNATVQLHDGRPPDHVVQQSGFRALREAPRHVRRLSLLAALYALGPWATIGFPLLSAAVMIQKGFRVGDSLLFAGVSMFGPTLGIGVAAFFVDRIGRRLALTLCAAVMAAIGLAFAISATFVPLLVLGNGFNLLSAVYSAVLSLYGAELFPTKLRGSATSGAWAVGRVVSALVPLALLPLLGAHGPLAMFGVIAAALLISLLLIAVGGPPGLARRPVE